jgi:hypothetical protein
MRVKATKLGYYGHVRVKSGSIICLESPEHFSENWMEKLDEEDAAPKRKVSRLKSDAVAVQSDEEVI